MVIKKKVVFLILFVCASASWLIAVAPQNCSDDPAVYCIQGTGSEWATLLNEFKQCRTSQDDLSACNIFVGQALERLFGVADFKKDNGSYMVANEIYAYLHSPDKQPAMGHWTQIGSDGFSIETLDTVQQKAQNGNLVIAISEGNPNGHIVLIVPGVMRSSESWGKSVPCSAGFILNKASKSYVGCPLSFAWQPKDATNIRFFCRNCSN